MPRPGPRPYECVRRAWHSDRHHPMRGSIIQQIFRVVNEAHSSATSKNREWQEKLPVVVLKAEEIMYSKANSEAEYMNPDTLWDRLNDAIDTIIRRDESTETGDLLQPCIEAALVLGCVPVRASRSQRHSIPRSYLSPRVQAPPQVGPARPAAPAVSDSSNNERPAPQPSNTSSNQSSMLRPIIANQVNAAYKSDSHMTLNTNQIASHNVPIIRPNVLHGVATSVPVESNMAIKMGSVYPLYYGTHFQTVEPQFGLHFQQNANPSNVIIGMPIGRSAAKPAHFRNMRNLFPGEDVENAAGKLRQENLREASGKASEIDCDLSLRLGRLGDLKDVTCETRDAGASSCQECSKVSEPSSQNHEFCFFLGKNASYPPVSCYSKQHVEGEVEDITKTLGKRKVPPLHDTVDCVHGQQDLQSDKLTGLIRWPGL
ncbi:hypothetical protein Ancab_006861 [Ancistrocladus abbreviatus]